MNDKTIIPKPYLMGVFGQRILRKLLSSSGLIELSIMNLY